MEPNDVGLYYLYSSVLLYWSTVDARAVQLYYSTHSTVDVMCGSKDDDDFRDL